MEDEGAIKMIKTMKELEAIEGVGEEILIIGVTEMKTEEEVDIEEDEDVEYSMMTKLLLVMIMYSIAGKKVTIIEGVVETIIEVMIINEKPNIQILLKIQIL